MCHLIKLTESSERIKIELQTYDRWHKATTFDVFEPTNGINPENRDDFVIGFLADRIQIYMGVVQIMDAHYF